MQSRRRKAGAFKAYRGLDGSCGKAATRLNTLILGIILLAGGCSSAPKMGADLNQKIQSSLANLCLNGEGKGRLETKAEKLVFSYASKLDSKMWHLGLSFPLHGEEDLLMTFPADLKPAVVKGPLVRRFEQGMGKMRARQVLKRLSKFMGHLSEAQVHCESPEQCQLGESAEKLRLIETERGQYALELGDELLALQLNLPKAGPAAARWSLIWWSRGEKDPVHEQILLFPRDCAR